MKFIKKDGLVINLDNITSYEKAQVENWHIIRFYSGSKYKEFTYQSKNERDDKFKRIGHLLAVEEL